MMLSTGSLAAATALHGWRTLVAWTAVGALAIDVIAMFLGANLYDRKDPRPPDAASASSRSAGTGASVRMPSSRLVAFEPQAQSGILL